jgi:hypothetical protein
LLSEVNAVRKEDLAMGITIFHHESNAQEESLIVNDDGSVTHEVENSGWVMVRGGLNRRSQEMTAAAAKDKWKSYAGAIDEALEKVNAKRA